MKVNRQIQNKPKSAKILQALNAKSLKNEEILMRKFYNERGLYGRHEVRFGRGKGFARAKIRFGGYVSGR